MTEFPVRIVGDAEGLGNVFAKIHSSAMAFGYPRMVRPWEFPDRNPMPRMDLFPRLTRAKARWDAIVGRVNDIAYAARYGIHDQHDW